MADPIAFGCVKKKDLIPIGNRLVVPKVPHIDAAIRKHHLCGGGAFFVALVPTAPLAAHLIDRNSRSTKQRSNGEFRHRQFRCVNTSHTLKPINTLPVSRSRQRATTSRRNHA